MAVIPGTNGIDNLVGTAAADDIDALAGNDLIEGLGGADDINGGDGSDTATYISSSTAVQVNLATGMGAGGDAEGDILVSIEGLIGSNFADILTGGAGNEAFGGRLGDDLIEGGGGADSIDGGIGIDTARYTGSPAAVQINLGAFTATGGDAQGDQIFNTENLTGSAFGDMLTGDGIANVLDGGGGDDTLNGAAGGDTLIGGAGKDTAVFSGTQASATITQENGKIIVVSADGRDTLEGIETLQFSDGSVLVADLFPSTEPTMLSIVADQPAGLKEGDSGFVDFTFTITRSGDTSGVTAVDWGLTGGAVAVDALDFGGGIQPGTGTVVFGVGETAQTITFSIQGDTTPEPDEQFVVSLFFPTGGATIIQSSAVGTVLNDDLPDDDLGLQGLFADNANTAKGLAAAYHTLLGGVPNVGGFVSLISTAVSTNFGAGPGPVFNPENIYINLFNNLVQGNMTAKARFDAIATGTTLQEKITSIYQALIPASVQSTEGLAFITRPDGLAFYAQVAFERGVAGTDGAAIVAMASLMRIVVEGNYGIGNAVNDLMQAVAAGSHAIPATGSTFTDIEVADGTAFDADDAMAVARMASSDESYAYIDHESADAAMDAAAPIGVNTDWTEAA